MVIQYPGILLLSFSAPGSPDSARPEVGVPWGWVPEVEGIWDWVPGLEGTWDWVPEVEGILGLDLSVNAKSRSTLQSRLLALKALAPVEIEIGA